MIREWKEKRVVLKKSSSAKSKEVCSFILLTSPITSLILECYFVSLLFSPFFLDPPSFILSLIFISTFHLYAKWLVLRPVPSTLPIGPFILLTSPITSLILECYFVSLLFSPFFLDPPSFILSLIFISTFHLYAKWLVLRPVPSNAKC